MEDRMHSPRGREVGFVGGRGEDLFYFQRSFASRGEYPRRVVEVQVLVIEPDLISCFPWGETGVYVVFHEKSSFFVGGNSFFPSFGKEMEGFF